MSTRLQCPCGGVIQPPVPERCPHCGARIGGVRRSALVAWWPVAVVLGLFALVVGALIYLVQLAK